MDLFYRVISAPTGTGKTVVHELSIVRLALTKSIQKIKVLLLTPSKALCQQRRHDWHRKFGVFGMTVLELTGDVDTRYSLKYIAQANIIIATPGTV